MCFLIEDQNLLEKYNTIWDKVTADIIKELNSEPVYSKKFLEAAMRSYGIKLQNFFHD